MISIVIPTLNEDGVIGATLASIERQDAGHEVVVVDAGSADATREIAVSAGARVVVSGVKGRSSQMNLGACEARGEALLFLHADTRLPRGGLAGIERALANPGVVGGGFTRSFKSPSVLLRFTCALATIRCRALGWFLGDQGIFVRRDVFERMRGYRDMSLFEDLDFSRRMAKEGKVVTLRPGVESSARRFARRGEFATTMNDFLLTCQYLAGTKPEVLRERLKRYMNNGD